MQLRKSPCQTAGNLVRVQRAGALSSNRPFKPGVVPDLEAPQKHQVGINRGDSGNASWAADGGPESAWACLSPPHVKNTSHQISGP